MKRRIPLYTFLMFLAMLGLFLAFTTGCSTIAGFGQDLTRMSNWTQEKLDNGFTQRNQEEPQTHPEASP